MPPARALFEGTMRREDGVGRDQRVAEPERAFAERADEQECDAPAKSGLDDAARDMKKRRAPARRSGRRTLRGRCDGSWCR